MSEKNKIIENDRKYIWHPFTQMKEYNSKEHIEIVKGKGIYLYDRDGNKYIDTISSWWVNIHGHSNKSINRAIEKQMKKIEHVNFSGFTHAPAVELAERIVDSVGGSLTKVFYSDNGSTAVEIALKMSYQYWKNKGKSDKQSFIYFDRSYHGDTLGAVSVGGVELFHSIFKPLLFNAAKFPSPNCSKCKYKNEEGGCGIECDREIEAFLIENHNTVCGIIIEPMIQAAGGMIFHKKEFLVMLKRLADKYSVHLIFDEVATGFGRTGKMWAMEHPGIRPDFLCLSKGISGGYLPLAVTVTTDDIYEAFYSDEMSRTFFHGHSYTANPIACAAGVESMKLFENNKIIEQNIEKSRLLALEMEKFEKFEFVENTRVLGMVGAFNLTVKGLEQKIYAEGFKHGLVLRPLTGVCYFMLPLSITEKEIKSVIKKSITTLESLDMEESMSTGNTAV